MKSASGSGDSSVPPRTEIKYDETYVSLLKYINSFLKQTKLYYTSGDVVGSIDYNKLLDYHMNNGSDATMCVRKSSYQILDKRKAYETNDYWIDIGNPIDYEKMNRDFND